MDTLLFLADGANQITMSLEWLAATVVAILGATGGGARLVWGYFTGKIKEMEDRLTAAIVAKDGQITALQFSLDTARREHSQAVERLQGVTLTKMEQFNEKVVGLVERVVEQQAEVAAILRSVQVQIDRRGSDSGPSA